MIVLIVSHHEKFVVSYSTRIPSLLHKLAHSIPICLTLDTTFLLSHHHNLIPIPIPITFHPSYTVHHYPSRPSNPSYPSTIYPVRFTSCPSATQSLSSPLSCPLLSVFQSAIHALSHPIRSNRFSVPFKSVVHTIPTDWILVIILQPPYGTFYILISFCTFLTRTTLRPPTNPSPSPRPLPPNLFFVMGWN